MAVFLDPGRALELPLFQYCDDDVEGLQNCKIDNLVPFRDLTEQHNIANSGTRRC
jgi:hypothetical protein